MVTSYFYYYYFLNKLVGKKTRAAYKGIILVTMQTITDRVGMLEHPSSFVKGHATSGTGRETGYRMKTNYTKDKSYSRDMGFIPILLVFKYDLRVITSFSFFSFVSKVLP